MRISIGPNGFTIKILVLTVLIFAFSCHTEKKEKPPENTDLSFMKKLEELPDSINILGIVIKNLFKGQILAHKGNEYDSTMIIEKVYRPHQKLFDNCYAMIFGESNAPKFNTKKGMIAWNDTLYLKNKNFFDDQASNLLEMNYDSLIKKHLAKFNKMAPYEVHATISILFAPFADIKFGGCTNNQFALELNNRDESLEYELNIVLPHELNHLAYEPTRIDDPDKDSALRFAIDEGFACYFAWVFLDKDIPKYEAVEDMTENEWNWYLENEADIYNKVKPYFADESGQNPLLRNDQLKLFPDAPKSLNYWLGFRIVENYVKNHGEDSWKDIYEKDVSEVLKESKYEDFINGLN